MVNVLKLHPDEAFDFFWNDQLPGSTKSIDSRPRSLYFLKWISVFNFFTGSNYWLTALYLSGIAFFGSWYFWKILDGNFPELKAEAFVSILFVPSIVLWGSGVIKESIAAGFLFC